MGCRPVIWHWLFCTWSRSPLPIHFPTSLPGFQLSRCKRSKGQGKAQLKANRCAAGQHLCLSQYPACRWCFTEHITLHMPTMEDRQRRCYYSHSKNETTGSQMSDFFLTDFKWQIQDMNFYHLTLNLALVLHFAISISVILKQDKIRFRTSIDSNNQYLIWPREDS